MEKDVITSMVVEKILNLFDEDILCGRKDNKLTIWSWCGNSTQNYSWRSESAENWCKCLFLAYSAPSILVISYLTVMNVKTISYRSPGLASCDLRLLRRRKEIIRSVFLELQERQNTEGHHKMLNCRTSRSYVPLKYSHSVSSVFKPHIYGGSIMCAHVLVPMCVCMSVCLWWMYSILYVWY